MCGTCQHFPVCVCMCVYLCSLSSPRDGCDLQHPGDVALPAPLPPAGGTAAHHAAGLPVCVLCGAETPVQMAGGEEGRWVQIFKSPNICIGIGIYIGRYRNIRSLNLQIFVSVSALKSCIGRALVLTCWVNWGGKEGGGAE